MTAQKKPFAQSWLFSHGVRAEQKALQAQVVEPPALGRQKQFPYWFLPQEKGSQPLHPEQQLGAQWLLGHVGVLAQASWGSKKASDIPATLPTILRMACRRGSFSSAIVFLGSSNHFAIVISFCT